MYLYVTIIFDLDLVFFVCVSGFFSYELVGLFAGLVDFVFVCLCLLSV